MLKSKLEEQSQVTEQEQTSNLQKIDKMESKQVKSDEVIKRQTKNINSLITAAQTLREKVKTQE